MRVLCLASQSLGSQGYFPAHRDFETAVKIHVLRHPETLVASV